MAQKRMFDKSIIRTDKFCDMSMSAKALYFILGMEADDYGFVSPKMIMRMHNASDDDLRILIAKGFVILFDTGVVVITDWNKNNWLDKRRLVDTEYKRELRQLKVEENRYCLAVAKPLLRENRIEQNSIEENSIVYNNYCSKNDTTFKENDITQKNDIDNFDTKIILSDTKNDIHNKSSKKSKKEKLEEVFKEVESMFNVFWNSYPRKDNKSKAKESFSKVFLEEGIRQDIFEKILNKLEIYKKTKQWQNKQYIPMATTWLNQKRYEDEIGEVEVIEEVFNTSPAMRSILRSQYEKE